MWADLELNTGLLSWPPSVGSSVISGSSRGFFLIPHKGAQRTQAAGSLQATVKGLPKGKVPLPVRFVPVLPVVTTRGSNFL